MRIQRRLFLAFVGFIIATLVPTALLLDRRLRDDLRDDVRESLTGEARILAEELDRAPPPDLAAWSRALESTAGARVTVVALDGRVLGDSATAADRLSALENHGARPEVARARAGAIGIDVRRSATLDRDMMYVAAPVGTPPRMVLRLALSLDSVERSIARARSATLTGAALALALALVLGYLLARSLSRPVLAMTRAAQAMSRGDFDVALPPARDDELGDLVRALGTLSRQLRARLDELRNEGVKLRTILDGMTEGVALVEGGVIAVANPAFATLLGAGVAVEGRTPIEAARVPTLAEAIAEATSREAPSTGSAGSGGAVTKAGSARAVSESGSAPVVSESGSAPVVSSSESSASLRRRVAREVQAGDRTLVAQVLPLGDEGAAVVVLLDVTDARRLERVRRDFVANASHELRTPVAAILAAADTLAAGAAEDPQARAQFLGMLSRHAQRLSRLTADLLDLSRLEAGYRPRIEAVSLAAALAAALAPLRPRAAAKQIELEARPTSLPPLRAERAAVEQILTNLLDNAIKYTPERGRVSVTAAVTAAAERSVTITVSDTGPGIPAAHLGRLFERFYRVDDARSRELGGTGLGLAIVKHLALAHGGDVSVDSEVGHGTRFHVRLPLA